MSSDRNERIGQRQGQTTHSSLLVQTASDRVIVKTNLIMLIKNASSCSSRSKGEGGSDSDSNPVREFVGQNWMLSDHEDDLCLRR